MSYVLGISAFYHDSAATLLKNGEIVAAAQEERFTRKKHDSSFPVNSIEFLLDYSKIKIQDINSIVFYEKPFLKFERLLETYLAYAPFGLKSFFMSMPIWLKEKLFLDYFLRKIIKEKLGNIDKNTKIYFSEHHLSHAASAFFSSPFEEALILTLDGVGEWTTTSVALGKKNKIDIIEEIHFPHSIGLLYSAFTYYTGFEVNGGEYKLMGLAPYGESKYVEKIKENLIDIAQDGSFKLNMEYFEYPAGLKMTNKKFNKLFGYPVRKKDTEITQFYMDIAASIQQVTEEIVLKIVRDIKKKYNKDYLCMAGGVALNCVANGKIIKEKVFKDVWFQPAAGDAGGSLGAAQAFWYIQKDNHRNVNIKKDSMKGSLLGPSFSEFEVEKKLNEMGAKFKVLSIEELVDLTSNDLKNGKSVGWFQGRMEFGPRALGSRSILADPRDKNMQKNLNLKIKYRESFRPFAPIILESELSKWFNLEKKSPYMLIVSDISNYAKTKEHESIKKNNNGLNKLKHIFSKIPAVTHVDYSARIQTVNEKDNERLFKLLTKFNEKTECPILVNTSFNVRDEPIVNTPEDAYKCFLATELDTLVIENFYLTKKDNKL